MKKTLIKTVIGMFPKERGFYDCSRDKLSLDSAKKKEHVAKLDQMLFGKNEKKSELKSERQQRLRKIETQLKGEAIEKRMLETLASVENAVCKLNPLRGTRVIKVCYSFRETAYGDCDSGYDHRDWWELNHYFALTAYFSKDQNPYLGQQVPCQRPLWWDEPERKTSEILGVCLYGNVVFRTGILGLIHIEVKLPKVGMYSWIEPFSYEEVDQYYNTSSPRRAITFPSPIEIETSAKAFFEGAPLSVKNPQNELELKVQKILTALNEREIKFNLTEKSKMELDEKGNVIKPKGYFEGAREH